MLLQGIRRYCCLALLPLAGLSDAGQGKALAHLQGIAHPAVIAHRGASFDAPESTAPAYLLARELGADYLELDLQRSRDGVLVAVHDDNLLRTSDVAQRFPERKSNPVSAFTLAELKLLDVGSWFNKAYPERARSRFVGLKIQTLDEVIDIAEGDPRKQPGLYIETKKPRLFPGIEAQLKARLQARGWLEQPGRVVLQSFDRSSLALLQQEMPQVPRVLLLWIGDGGIEPASKQTFAQSGESDKAAFYARQQPESQAEFERWLDYAKATGAVGVGPSAARSAGGAQSYADLAQPWMNRLSHDKQLLVHVYTVDEEVDFAKVMAAGVDGIFTNRSGNLLRHFSRPAALNEVQILDEQGY